MSEFEVKPQEVSGVLIKAHQYITYECKKEGISVNKLCKLAGVDRSAFQRWKNTTPQSLETFAKLCDTLDQLENTQAIV